MQGDAAAPAVLEGAGIHKARAIVMAINDPSALFRAIPTARELNPAIYILARTHYVTNIEPLLRSGADDIVTDELGAGLEMSAFLLQRFNVPEGRVLKILSGIREEHHQLYQHGTQQPRHLTGYLSVLEGGEIEIQAVPESSPCLGKTLAELNFRAATGASIMGIIRSERVIYNPPADLHLETGDTLILLGEDENIRKARELVHGHSTKTG